MSLPSLDELLDRRKIRKAKVKEIYQNMPIAKSIFRESESNTENFLVTNYSMIEDGDKEIAQNIKRQVLMLGFICILPVTSVSLYYFRKKPLIRWYFSTAIFGSCLFFPFMFWSSYYSMNYEWLRLYLVEKYEERIYKYHLNNDPNILKSNIEKTKD